VREEHAAAEQHVRFGARDALDAAAGAAVSGEARPKHSQQTHRAIRSGLMGWQPNVVSSLS
jgi:hypothetical protein